MSVHQFRAASRNQPRGSWPFEVVFDVPDPTPDPDREPGVPPKTIERVEQFAVETPLPAMPVVDHALLEVDGASDAVIYLSAGRALRALLGEEQWPRFHAAATAARFDATDLVAVLRTIVEETTGRPTRPSSDSAGSQPTSGTSSSGGTDSQAADPFSTPSQEPTT